MANFSFWSRCNLSLENQALGFRWRCALGVSHVVSSQSQQSRCPFCSSGSMLNRFALKGFNDALKIIFGTSLEAEVPPTQLDDSYSDFEDP